MRRLTQLFLVSTCLFSALPTAAFSAVQTVNVNANLDADGKAEGVKFTGAAILTVPAGSNIGNVLGVSVVTTALLAESIVFQGDSTVSGSISAAGDRVDFLELQGGALTTVNLNGVTTLLNGASKINFTTLSGSALNVNANLTMGAGGVIDFKDKGAGSTVTFADGVNFSGAVNTDAPGGFGSVIFKGSSTVTDGLLGSNFALLDVQLGSGTVYLNKAGDNKAVTFKFTENTGSNTLKLANGANLIGAITTDTSGAGTIVFEQDSAITGNVGTLAKPLALLRMTDVTSGVTITGDVYATTTQLLNSAGNTNTLTLSATAGTTTVNTNIITATDGKGVVDLAKVGIFIGDIGTSTARLNKVLVGAANNIAVTGNIHVTNGVIFQAAPQTLTIADGNFINGSVIGFGGGGGTLTFLGSSQSNGILGATNPLTAVNFKGGTFNLSHDINAPIVTVSNNATLVFNKIAPALTDLPTLSGALTLDATGANLIVPAGLVDVPMPVNSKVVRIGGNLTTAANSVISIDLNSPDLYGQLLLTGAGVADFTNAPIFDITTSGYIPNNSVLTIIQGSGAVVVGPGTLKNTGTLLSNFALAKNGNNIELTVTRNTNASLAEPYTAGIAGALDVIQNTPALIGNPDIFAVVNQLDNFTDRTSFNQAIATLAPSVDGDNFQGLMAMTRLGVDTIRERLDDYRLGKLDYEHTGYAAGSYNTLKDYGVWVKLLASRLKQEAYKGIEGYKSDVYGIAGGIDYTSPDNELVYGVGFNYSSTESISRSLAASTNDIDSYSLMLYGTYNFPNPWYVDGILYLSQHDYEIKRNIRAGAVSSSAASLLEAWQISARAETGFVYQYNKILFQPTLGLFYSYLDRDNYTETSGGGLSLVNRPGDIESLRLSVGSKISSVLGSAGASLIPEFHAYYNFEILGAREQYLSNFVVGGPIFETNGIEPKRSSYVLGVALSAYGFENISCHVALDYEFNETKFSAFHGSMKFKYTW